MNSKKRLIAVVKILVVAVILAALGVCVVPQFHCICDVGDGRLSNLMSNLQSIRGQLELYREHHNGAYPANITEAMTQKTDVDGTISVDGSYGPYMRQFPGNPFVTDPADAVKTTGRPGEGWDYDPATGVFLANDDTHVCYRRLDPYIRDTLFRPGPYAAKQD